MPEVARRLQRGRSKIKDKEGPSSDTDVGTAVACTEADYLGIIDKLAKKMETLEFETTDLPPVQFVTFVQELEFGWHRSIYSIGSALDQQIFY